MEAKEMRAISQRANENKDVSEVLMSMKVVAQSGANFLVAHLRDAQVTVLREKGYTVTHFKDNRYKISW